MTDDILKRHDRFRLVFGYMDFPMRKENLFVLVHGDRKCPVKVLTFDKAVKKVTNLSIDIEEKTWRLGNSAVLKIGKESRTSATEGFGVIGVYNCSSIEHIQLMLNDGIKASRTHFSVD